MKRFKCKECGYIHIGEEAPNVCPVCAYDKSVFIEMDQVDSINQISYTMLDELDDTSIKILRQLIENTSKLAAVSSAMAKSSRMENNLELEKYFKNISIELLEQASIYMIYSGEFLDFSSNANKLDLEKKLKNEISRLDKFIDSIANLDIGEVLGVLEGNKKKLIELQH